MGNSILFKALTFQIQLLYLRNLLHSDHFNMSLVPRWVHFMLMHSILSDFPKSSIIAFSHLKAVLPLFPDFDPWCWPEQSLVQTIWQLWDCCCWRWRFLFPWSNTFGEQMQQSASFCLLSAQPPLQGSNQTGCNINMHFWLFLSPGLFYAVNEKLVLLGFTGAADPKAVSCV